jgi:hypothetical protein
MKSVTVTKKSGPAVFLVLLSCISLAGCEPVSMTLLGVGTATGVGHTLDGMAYRTFTAPVKDVREATKVALKRMGINSAKIETVEGGEKVLAEARDRKIEITLESISGNATRMKSVARIDTFFMDKATATEIILQTERVLVEA